MSDLRWQGRVFSIECRCYGGDDKVVWISVAVQVLLWNSCTIKMSSPDSHSPGSRKSSFDRDHDTPHELPPLPTIPNARTRNLNRGNIPPPISSTTTSGATPAPTSNVNPPTSSISTTTPAATSTPAPFSPLSKTASRLSQLSNNRSFVDSVGFVGFTELKKVETRTIRVGKGFLAVHGTIEGDTSDDLESGKGGRNEDETGDKEIDVAVQITPDGTEITFPDGGLEVRFIIRSLRTE